LVGWLVCASLQANVHFYLQWNLAHFSASLHYYYAKFKVMARVQQTPDLNLDGAVSILMNFRGFPPG